MKKEPNLSDQTNKQKRLKPTFFVHFSVAVLACFVTFRTPLHIEKAIFVITTVTQKWDDNMVYYHGILKLIAGKILLKFNM